MSSSESVEDPVVATPEKMKEQLDQALERQEKPAEGQLEMAKLFIGRGKTEIAKRRLQEILDLYGKSESAKEARKLLKRL